MHRGETEKKTIWNREGEKGIMRGKSGVKEREGREGREIGERENTDERQKWKEKVGR